MMKSAELKVLSAELKDRPQGAGHLPSAKVLLAEAGRLARTLFLTQDSALSTQY
ncbi:MAG: hypothetical protein RMY16_05330 [Nostoc sp. DedQUE12b]|uniref:hypothetical protein n=1 Tax=Nostoc sp. DedQUE12b TaxID=3075398 RepID=UPI002AD41D89|nr:hypothetical protein [Nostoc sp. DedQUE12b]MDZ8085009.1 hypothetical protein [Nostoc sp. DedQUE12b]